MKSCCYLINVYIFIILMINVESLTTYLNELLNIQCNDPLVTLHVYSSQLNPRWKLNQKELISLKNLANEIIEQNKTEELLIKSSTRVVGYQGFSIICNDKDPIYINGIKSIENALLESGQTSLSPSIIEHVKQHIGESFPKITPKSLSSINCNIVPIKGPDTVPIYSPQTDNGGCFISKQSNNNCYAYGVDIVTNSYPQPGRYNGKAPSPLTCESVGNAAIRDGLIYKGSTFPTDQPKIGHYLALFLWPHVDYHWLRKDANGYWSHKPGPGRVTNRDNKGLLIYNPLKGNFTPWTLFCGYYIAQPSKVHIF